MNIIDWNENMKVGIAELDNQHKKLIELINQLHEAMGAGKGKDILGTVLSELIKYTVYHFGSEEKLFRQYNYPETESHKQEHILLTQKAVELQKGFESGKVTVTLETMKFLRDWLTNHIMKVDKQYGPFLNGKGVR